MDIGTELLTLAQGLDGLQWQTVGGSTFILSHGPRYCFDPEKTTLLISCPTNYVFQVITDTDFSHSGC